MSNSVFYATQESSLERGLGEGVPGRGRASGRELAPFTMCIDSAASGLELPDTSTNPLVKALDACLDGERTPGRREGRLHPLPRAALADLRRRSSGVLRRIPEEPAELRLVGAEEESGRHVFRPPDRIRGQPQGREGSRLQGDPRR